MKNNSKLIQFIKKTDKNNVVKLIIKIYSNQKLWLLGVIMFFVLMSVLYAVASIVNHNAYQTWVDLAIFSNGIWQYSKFKFPYMYFHLDRYFLGDHFHPILILLAPLFWIYPNETTLLIVQPFITLSAIIPVYLIGLKLTKSNFFSFAICLALAFYIPLQRALFEDFHEVVFILRLFAWAFYFYISNNRKAVSVLLGLMLLVKEEFGFLVATFGLYIFLTNKKWRIYGLIMAVVGVSFSLLLINIIIPTIGGNYLYGNYGVMGNSIWEVVFNLAKNPGKIIEIFFVPKIKQETLISTFWPFAFLPLANLFGLMFSTEQFFSRFADYNHIYRWRNDMHHSVPMIIIVAIGTILSVNTITHLFPKYKKYLYAFFALSLIYLTCIQQINTSAILLIRRPQFWQRSDWAIFNDRAISIIPKNASLATQRNLLSHVSIRDRVFKLSEYKQASYILVDFHPGQPSINYSDENFSNKDWEQLESILVNSVTKGELSQLYHEGNTYVFKRNSN